MTRNPILIAALIGLAAASLFVTLASRNIDAQGLYQDEVFQASGAFAYVGRPCVGSLCAFGLPLLSGPYEGGIKSALYGLYMRISGRPFTAASWRMFAIVAVALGIVAFAWLARRALPPLPLLFALLLTAPDCTALLTTRHDWGPTALALLLRILLIAMLARKLGDERSARRNGFAVGLLLGIAFFEKPSVLAAPVLLALAFQPLWRRWRSAARWADRRRSWPTPSRVSTIGRSSFSRPRTRVSGPRSASSSASSRGSFFPSARARSREAGFWATRMPSRNAAARSSSWRRCSP